MFCPTCGREETQERKFCTSCGTNLERVTKALSPRADGFLTRTDKALDQWMARYAGMFFSGAASKAADWRTGNSWQLLGQSFLALLANFLLFWVMLFVAVPVRFVTLLIASPFRLLSERSSKTNYQTAELEAAHWAASDIPSVTDSPTIKMSDPSLIRRQKA